jgi:type VI secretion system protein ImpF
MAELTERLQPSLLDRLTDDEPDQTTESRDKRFLSSYRLRDSVKRDLVWLLNTVQLGSAENLEPYPEVDQSTLNYGLPDLAGKTKSSIDVEQMARELRRAIWTYEPRLLRRSIKVKLIGDPEQIEHNNLSFSIEAELWAQPAPLRLFLRTELDLENGEARVTEVGGAGAG